MHSVVCIHAHMYIAAAKPNFKRLNALYDVCSGSHGAFRRVYEDPIVQSRQPTATAEEKEIGETRANEVLSC